MCPKAGQRGHGWQRYQCSSWRGRNRRRSGVREQITATALHSPQRMTGGRIRDALTSPHYERPGALSVMACLWPCGEAPVAGLGSPPNPPPLPSPPHPHTARLPLPPAPSPPEFSPGTSAFELLRDYALASDGFTFQDHSSWKSMPNQEMRSRWTPFPTMPSIKGGGRGGDGGTVSEFSVLPL